MSDTRHALLSYLAEKQGPTGRLGKKAAQKFIHILSSLNNKDYGYEFSFYTYGTFSRELAADLDILNSAGYIKVTYNSFENSYSILPGKNARRLISKQITADMKQEVNLVWDKFSGRTAKELELISTILFVRDEENLQIKSPEMRERVRELKPKYSDREIYNAQDELSAMVN